MSSFRYKPTNIEISESDPFKDDLLERKNSAEVLTQFVSSLSEPFVFAIDSPWGTGKTTFLRMWKQHLRNRGIPCLYFNAWENDFSESPLVSLIGEIGAGIKSFHLEGKQEEFAEKAFEKAKNVGVSLLKVAIPTAIKLATSGLLDLSAMAESDLSKLAEDIAKRQIEKYQADKETLSNFRTELETFIKTLSVNKSDGAPNPLIFVVDELDRCRPSYAIELLEKIKHLFSVEGLIFVLAIDRQQLGESVKALYGTGIDADGYLRRFIDLEYRLPATDPTKFSQAQFSRFGLNALLDKKTGYTSVDASDLREHLPILFSAFRLSLRTQEQCFTQLAVIIRITPHDSFLYSILLMLLICLRSANRELYERYCSGLAKPKDVISYITSLPSGAKLMESNLGTQIEAYLVLGIRDEQLRKTTIQNYHSLSDEANSKRTNEAFRAQAVSHHFTWRAEHVSDLIGYLLKKIEMAHNFVQS